MWDLDPWPRNEPRPPALGTQSLSQWTTREVPKRCIIFSFPLFFKVWPKQLQVFGEFCILYSVAQPRPSSTDVTPSVPSMSIPGCGGVTYSLVLPLPGTLWDSSVQFGHSVTELLKTSVLLQLFAWTAACQASLGDSTFPLNLGMATWPVLVNRVGAGVSCVTSWWNTLG